MSADVIRLWSGEHEKRIRIPGPGEDNLDAVVIILPVIRIERRAEPKRRTPKRKVMNPCSVCNHHPMSQIRTDHGRREVRLTCGCGGTTEWVAAHDRDLARAEWNRMNAPLVSLP